MKKKFEIGDKVKFIRSNDYGIIQSDISERKVQVEDSSKFLSIVNVDEIIPYETEEELLALLNHLPLHVRIIGEDYKGKDFTGKDAVPVHYNKRQHDYSTSGLRRNVVIQDCCWLPKKEKENV